MTQKITLKHKTTEITKYLLILTAGILLSGCAKDSADSVNKGAYGVFIGIDDSQADRLADYETVVIDAEYFTAAEIEKLKAQGKTVYTYIDLGSLENFRDYYDRYSYLALGDYEGWDEEKWVDVSSPDWQEHFLNLAGEYEAKGVDGFFVDNCDVYYFYPEEDIYKGLVSTLKELNSLGKKVIINGGDAFVTRYLDENGEINDIMTGVNQESVLTCGDEEESVYYQEYIAACKENGAEVYVLEYTSDEDMIRETKKFCEEHGYEYYISDSLELN